MNYECFRVQVDEGVAHLNMCRPDKANSMTDDFWDELPRILDELDENGDVRVCILSAQGKNFCGGMDLSFFAKPEFARLETGRRREVVIGLVGHLQDVFGRLERVRFPVIAAVQGACIGGALDMIAACDLRYASADARFSIEEINIGMMADLGSLQRLPHLMPEGVVREMAYVGVSLDAARAKETGLVNQVFKDHGELMDRVKEMARTIASKSPLAVSATKKAFAFSRNHGSAAALEHVRALQGALLEPDDIQRAVKARMGKKDGRFDDLLALLGHKGKRQGE